MSDIRIVVPRTGGAEVLEQAPAVFSEPGPGEVRVRHEAIGVNFIDIYYRKGVYPLDLPSGLGTEAAGIVEAVGEGVTHVTPGDRIAYAGGPLGAYCSVRTMPAAPLVRLPDGVDSRIAAAAMLKGLTVDMLVGACGKVQAGQTALVHAAAGGVGSLLIQWLKALGTTVIAHTGTPEKAARAQRLGADHAFHGPLEGLAEQVRAATGGRGVDVVFDSVGRDSWAPSIASVAKRGLIISFGNASGPVDPVAPLALMRAGSVFLTRPTLGDYTATPEERTAAADRLFAMLESGKVRVDIGAEWPLAEAGKAQEAIESRATTGSTILIP
ncbi:quinone oxidoreductase [Sphingomonas sp. AP4-R1]|uniref:quinone oxidoreductase family protein n=1 Tax=Sphingomonas sp. AP4-R1 TaxID=2735134 RepID=UPI001493A977|nr:quinone oxidoreductase [Sphingomonas sp. AP4-R1]QJU57230.1 quinone oxidoreductase [Sphingomonas sp. AP4-R1]